MQELLTLAQPRVRRTLVYLDLGGMATVKAQPQTGDAADLAVPATAAHAAAPQWQVQILRS